MSYADRLAVLMHEPSTDAGDDPSRLRRVELSRIEMMAQGPAIQATLAGEAARSRDIAARFGDRRLGRVVIIGCGDSLGIGMACRAPFERLLGVPTESVQALDFALYSGATVDSDTLVIGISASGKTEAVLDGLALARSKGAATLSLSNSPSNPLVAAADFALTVHATRNGWPTQSTTAAIALLSWLAVELAAVQESAPAEEITAFRSDIEALPAIVQAVTEAFDRPCRALGERFAAAPLILFAGAGSHQAAAFFGASKIRELSPVHAFSLPLEEYHHYRMQKPGDVLFLVAPDLASRSRALDTALVGRASGGRTVALVPEGEGEIGGIVEEALFMPPVRPELASIVYSVPLHLFSYHFTKARFARNWGHRNTLPATTP